MAIPRMCDVCEKLASGLETDMRMLQPALPKNWFRVHVSQEEVVGSAEVCSSKCAVKFVKGATAMDVTEGLGGSGRE